MVVNGSLPGPLLRFREGETVVLRVTNEHLLASALLGAWLMASPQVFGSRAPAAHGDHLLGALVVVVAIWQ